MDLHTEAVPGDKPVPDGSMRAEDGGDVAGPLASDKAALATARRTGVSQIVTKQGRFHMTNSY